MLKIRRVFARDRLRLWLLQGGEKTSSITSEPSRAQGWGMMLPTRAAVNAARAATRKEHERVERALKGERDERAAELMRERLSELGEAYAWLSHVAERTDAESSDVDTGVIPLRAPG